MSKTLKNRIISLQLLHSVKEKTVKKIYYNSLGKSDLFDPVWHLKSNADVAEANMDPIPHYLMHGGSERRDPSQLFDTSYYLSQLDELPKDQQNCSNSLLHYLRVGKAAGLLISILSSISYDFAIGDESKTLDESFPISSNTISIIVSVYNAT